MARSGSASSLADAARALGHEFARPALLDQALTHPSASSAARPDNQRLEFLGDRVLGLVIAEALIARHPAEAEGALAPRLNDLVRKETCADIAAEVGIDGWLRLGKSESTTGGRRKVTLLGDAMEAVIAAVYLDGGMAAAQGMILRLWKKRITEQGEAPRDAKTALQEWAQGRGMAPPKYDMIARTGPDHAPMFTIAATLETGETATADAKSKRIAEQAAAAAMLKQIGQPQ